MDFSASAATKDAARLRRRRFCTPPRFFSTLPHRIFASRPDSPVRLKPPALPLETFHRQAVASNLEQPRRLGD
jgi:hypothetical protein